MTVGICIRIQAVLMAFGMMTAISFDTASAADGPADLIATQIRAQGYKCETPKSATRDSSASRPNADVWILECSNARYRVEIVPDMAAKVQQMN
jgi:hypothetical protein